MKNQILGSVSVFFGFLYLMFSFVFVTDFIPKIVQINSKLGDSSNSSLGAYIATFITFLIGLASFFLGYRLFKNSNSNELFNKILVFLLISLSVVGILYVYIAFSLVSPVYNLTN